MKNTLKQKAIEFLKSHDTADVEITCDLGLEEYYTAYYLSDMLVDFVEKIAFEKKTKKSITCKLD